MRNNKIRFVELGISVAYDGDCPVAYCRKISEHDFLVVFDCGYGEKHFRTMTDANDFMRRV